MDTANEKGPGVQTGAGNHDAAGIKYPYHFDTMIAVQAQFLGLAHHVRPELAVALSAIVFDGGAHG